ncbi:MAG: DUF4301 family protein [Bacteroidales bacterium]|nr:DUF4301 family protein [Bacteroidales bacterium]
MLTQKDLDQIKQKGISEALIEKQIENFKNGFPFAKLTAPATKGHGMQVFKETEINRLAALYNAEMPKYQLLKFVPASGAASRMFKHLFEFMESYTGSPEDLEKFDADQSFNSVWYFIHHIHKFAFIDDLKAALKNDSLDLEKLLAEKKYGVVVEYLLSDKGLGYARLPKGLLKFHQYNDFARMSLDEHLVEGAHYAKNASNEVHIHFTVSPEHRQKFNEVVATVQSIYEEKFNVKYHITFSEQKPATDTLAVDMQNNPFRESDGSLLFRPGGHGALIENLNDLQGDIIFVKNIDNIVPDRLREPTYLYKKVIGGLLIQIRQKSVAYLQKIESAEISDAELDEMVTFAREDMMLQLPKGFDSLNKSDKIKNLDHLMNRPIRVCGMVKNEGEPGGGPFWVENSKGEVSLQVVESSQIDMKDEVQKKMVQEATHFNPVDLVCSVRDYKGQPFDLKNYIDPATGFISIKSKDGKNLKAQELPGLWNGAMADWITVFVETPIITFNPVKTVNDLLREQHLNP